MSSDTTIWRSGNGMGSVNAHSGNDIGLPARGREETGRMEEDGQEGGVQTTSGLFSFWRSPLVKGVHVQALSLRSMWKGQSRVGQKRTQKDKIEPTETFLLDGQNLKVQIVSGSDLISLGDWRKKGSPALEAPVSIIRRAINKPREVEGFSSCDFISNGQNASGMAHVTKTACSTLGINGILKDPQLLEIFTDTQDYSDDLTVGAACNYLHNSVETMSDICTDVSTQMQFQQIVEKAGKATISTKFDVPPGNSDIHM